MSITKLSLARNNSSIPGQGELGEWHPGWGRENRQQTGGFFFFFFYALYSTLLHLPPLRFYCVGGCWDRKSGIVNGSVGAGFFWGGGPAYSNDSTIVWSSLHILVPLLWCPCPLFSGSCFELFNFSTAVDLPRDVVAIWQTASRDKCVHFWKMLF